MLLEFVCFVQLLDLQKFASFFNMSQLKTLEGQCIYNQLMKLS